MVKLLSVLEMRHMTREALELHKVRVCTAKLTASTDLEREAYDLQLQRVSSLLNEYRPHVEMRCYV